MHIVLGHWFQNSIEWELQEKQYKLWSKSRGEDNLFQKPRKDLSYGYISISFGKSC